MKTNASLLRQLAAIAAASALTLTGARAQVTATTDPVGFITLNVYGGSAATPRLSLVSPTLTQPVTWQGVITGVSGNTISVSGTPWTVGQFNSAFYVELISVATPAISGTLSDITGTPTTSSITTAQATGAAIGDTIKIRPDVTIANLFGATNSAGLQSSAGDASTADEVLIYSGANSISYFYYTGPGLPAGWYRSDTFSDGSQVTIAPSEAVVIKRKAAGDVPIVFNGAVKTGNTLIPIVSGLNVLGTASAKGLTLANSGLYTGNPATGVKDSAGDSSTADEIILYTATGQKSYFYYTGPGLPAGWYQSDTFGDASTIPIAPGTAFVLNRKNGAAAFNWVLPSPASF